jgi:hypothetical protein
VSNHRSSFNLIPAPVRAVVGQAAELRTQLPERAGIAISQGLRTGCNGFFYVDFVESLPEGRARIRVGDLFDRRELDVPAACLLPVLRRQTEQDGSLRSSQLQGRVLDLGAWVLPEDAAAVERAKHLYVREGLAVPQVMPKDLADFVRIAAQMTMPTNPERNESRNFQPFVPTLASRPTERHGSGTCCRHLPAPSARCVCCTDQSGDTDRVNERRSTRHYRREFLPLSGGEDRHGLGPRFPPSSTRLGAAPVWRRWERQWAVGP